VTSDGRLARRLGTTDAVAIGLGSMIGAGVFSVFAPAAGAAGSALVLALAIAALVAWCNALASAQLAAQYPTSGGTYVYGRERLGPWWGFFAGWGFVFGKTASCAAMATTVAVYVAPAGWSRPVAVVVVLAVGLIDALGVSRTATATRIIVACSLAVLALVAVAGAASGRFTAVPPLEWVPHGPYGVLQAAGLLFFAFAGYARIATMGEEVREPARTIPRAITISLSVALLVYLGVAVLTLGVLGPRALASASAPLAQTAAAGGWAWTGPVVAAGAALAASGALLALMAGIGRTTLAMARERDLPHWFAAVHPRYRVPHCAHYVLIAVVCVLVLVVDLRNAIGFSSFGVLLYYFTANAAAITQSRARRRMPRWANALGALGCVVLAAALPVTAVVGGVAVMALGLAVRLVSLRLRR